MEGERRRNRGEEKGHRRFGSGVTIRRGVGGLGGRGRGGAWPGAVGVQRALSLAAARLGKKRGPRGPDRCGPRAIERGRGGCWLMGP
jgi:hypothetical protein